MDTIRSVKAAPLMPIWLVVLVATMIFAGQVPAAAASGPWKLAFSLNHESINSALPTALYVDGDKERYYMVDSAGGQLVSFDKEGAFLTAFQPDEGLDRPFDLVRLSEAVLVVAEKGPNSLTVIDFAGQETKRLQVKDQGRPLMVDRLEIGNNGRLYALDRASGRIYRLTDSFTVAQRFDLPEEKEALVDFKVVGEQIWALGQQKKRLYVYHENGRLSKRLDVADLVVFPVSLAVDEAGLIYILDRHQGTVVVLDRKAKFKYRFLGKGHGPGHLYYPMEIRFDPWGRLCVVDEGNGRVQIFRR